MKIDPRTPPLVRGFAQARWADRAFYLATLVPGLGAVGVFLQSRRSRQRAKIRTPEEEEWIREIERTIEFQKEVIDLFEKYAPKYEYSLALVDQVKADLREKYGEIKAAGVTDHLGNSTINDDPNPYTREATRRHEAVHRKTILEGIKKYGGERTPGYVEWYVDAKRYAADEIKAYSTSIRYLEQSLRKLK